MSTNSELVKELEEIDFVLAHAQDDEISHHNFRLRTSTAIAQAIAALATQEGFVSVPIELLENALENLIEEYSTYYGGENAPDYDEHKDAIKLSETINAISKLIAAQES